MRVCYFGTYDQDYPRNRIVREGLRRNGVEVTECHRVLWAGTADKIARASGGWKQAGFLGKLIVTYLALVGDYARVGDHDVVLVGYAGLLDIYLAWLLTRFSRRPLVLDALLSVYNSIVNERKLAGPSSLKARVVYTLEQNACRLADRVLLDTQAHIHYFCELYGLEESRFVMVPIAADDRFFQRRFVIAAQRDGPERDAFRVVYHGKYVPNAGVEHILAAAALLSGDPNITFDFIGEGEGKAGAEQLAAQLGLPNVTFLGWIDKEDLAAYLQTYDVCLGNFGDTPQGQRAVSNKVIEGLALGLPVLTGDTAANREIVRHGETAFLCPVADAESLAAAICALKGDPALCRQLGEAGPIHFHEQFSPTAIGRRVRDLLKELVTP